jgi:hypothetical protein
VIDAAFSGRTSRLRAFTLAHINEDWNDFRAGILSLRSLVAGYRKQRNHVTLDILRVDGTRQRSITHNLRTTVGLDWESLILSGGNAADEYAGTAHASTAPTSTTLTVAGTPGFTASQMVDRRVLVPSRNVYGVIKSHTTGASPVLTVDQWTTIGTAGTVGTTPSTSDAFVIAGPAPARWLALTSTNITPAAGDTTLSGELSTNGLGRKMATYAHTPGASTYTMTYTFTYTGSSAQSIYGGSLFDAATGGTMVFEALFSNGVGTVNASGDQITVTWTITL